MTDKVNITTAFVKELINEILDGNKYNGDVFYRDQKLTGFGVKQQRSNVLNDSVKLIIIHKSIKRTV